MNTDAEILTETQRIQRNAEREVHYDQVGIISEIEG